MKYQCIKPFLSFHGHSYRVGQVIVGWEYCQLHSHEMSNFLPVMKGMDGGNPNNGPLGQDGGVIDFGFNPPDLSSAGSPDINPEPPSTDFGGGDFGGAGAGGDF